ncbi:MAG: FkbM family methyltransferase [Balneolales bacterium]
MKEKLKQFLKKLLSKRTFKIRFGIVEGLKIQGISLYAFGFLKKALTREEQFIKQLDLREKIVFDIGAYIGIFSMFFAKAVGPKGHVYIYEPNPINLDKVKNNLQINGFENAAMYPIALGAKKDTANLAFRGRGTATGSLQENIKSDILNEANSTVIEVEIDTLDNQISINDLPKPDFVKIDVEGLELDVLNGMQETLKLHKPDLYIEIHGSSTSEKIKNAKSVVDFLIGYGYLIYHVESEQSIATDNASEATEGHLWCQVKS